jgi:hypothetical protein
MYSNKFVLPRYAPNPPCNIMYVMYICTCGDNRVTCSLKTSYSHQHISAPSRLVVATTPTKTCATTQSSSRFYPHPQHLWYPCHTPTLLRYPYGAAVWCSTQTMPHTNLTHTPTPPMQPKHSSNSAHNKHRHATKPPPATQLHDPPKAPLQV